MTGKAARKKLKNVSVVVASAAFATTPKLLSASPLAAAAGSKNARLSPASFSGLTRSDFADPRLVLLDEIVRRAEVASTPASRRVRCRRRTRRSAATRSRPAHSRRRCARSPTSPASA